MVAKYGKHALAGTGVLGGASVVVYYAGYKLTNTEDKNKWENADKSNYSKGTVGNTYGENLLNTSKNKQKGIEQYKKLTDASSPKNTDFSDGIITSEFSDDDSNNTALNKKCEEYYKKTLGENDESNNIKIGGEKGNIMGKFCSHGDPKIIGDNNEYEGNSVGKTKSKELLSTKDEDNKELGEEKNKSFFKLTASPTEELFKKLYETKNNSSESNLKKTCEEAYKTKIENENQSKAEAAIKYCSLKTIA